jgi:hypothetical protein
MNANLRHRNFRYYSTKDTKRDTRTMGRKTKGLLVSVLAVGGIIAIASSAQAAQTYGAIAISAQAGVFGRVTGAPSQSEAERLAMAQCTQLGGTDCRLATWTRGRYCGALAVKTFANGGMSWATSTAPTLEQAKAGAMERCQQEAKSACDDVVADVCSAD